MGPLYYYNLKINLRGLNLRVPDRDQMEYTETAKDGIKEKMYRVAVLIFNVNKKVITAKVITLAVVLRANILKHECQSFV